MTAKDRTIGIVAAFAAIVLLIAAIGLRSFFVGLILVVAAVIVLALVIGLLSSRTR